jgi:hypothetical protein
MPKPCPAPTRDDLPHAITFFVSAGERERILKKLRRYGPDRTAALRAALGLARRSK